MSKTIIVTGGCGYIGSHVARAFKYADSNNRVLVIDRVLREHTLKGLDGFFVNDFASEESLATIFDLQPDIIVHCAGTSLVGPSVTDPADYYDNNVAKTVKLLNYIKDFEKKPTIMFSSSAAVYGDPEPEDLPLLESHLKRPMSPYGKSKDMIEEVLWDYARAYNLNSVVFRYFNAAGAEPHDFDLGQEPNATHIVARVLEASIAGRAFTIFGDDYGTSDGTCVRDYVHVWDIATAHVNAADFLERSTITGVADCHVFNLGTNQGISNKYIVDYVVNTYGLPFVNYGPKRPGDPERLIADATDAKTWLGWNPKHSSIEEIIDSAYKWYCRK
jgi:UDP-glucose 4-epimerase